MTAELRIRDLDESVEPDDVAKVIAKFGGCSPGEIKVGVIQCPGRGMGTLWVRCPTAVAGRLIAAKRIRVGWVNARVEELEPRPLQCSRCLEKGHVQTKCNGGANRAACCYKCGEEGHFARDCRVPVRCPVCASLGRPDKHRAGSRACTAPKKRAKGPTTQATQRATAPSSTQEGGSSSQGMAPPMEEVEMRE